MLLETSADAVNDALRRARAALRAPSAIRRRASPPRTIVSSWPPTSTRSSATTSRRSSSLLRDDAIVEMPPFDLWLRGTDDIREWLIAVDALADHTLTPVSANGSLAVAVYRPEEPGGEPTAFAIQVLDVVAGRISAIHSFIDPTLFEHFGLPNHPVF